MNLYLETTKKLNDDTAKQYQATLDKLKQICIEASEANQFKKGYSEVGIDYDVVCVNGSRCVFVYRRNGKVIIETGNTMSPFSFHTYMPNEFYRWECSLSDEQLIIEKFVSAINHYLAN